MLELYNSRVVESYSYTLARGIQLNEEGQPFNYVKQDGETVVAPAVTAGLFAGISKLRQAPPSFVPVYEEVTVASDGTFDFRKMPYSDQVRVTLDGTALTYVAPGGTAPTASQYTFEQVGDRVIGTTAVANAGKKLALQYKYEPTVKEARLIDGDLWPGGQPENVDGVVTLVTKGDLATSFFDAGADWSTALYVTIDNGLFVPTAVVADAIPNVVVKNIPGANSPFLQLELR